MKASMVVHAYNEGPALERLILSSLHAASVFDEWVVLDHRSNDDTQEVLDKLESLLAAYGVTLTRLFESRDLGSALSFADVRNRTVKAARNELVALMDADFVLGVQFRPVLENARLRFARDQNLATIRFRIPILWDHVRTDDAGNITSHGRYYRHGYSHRILRRDVIEYRQTGKDGRFEKAHYPGKRRADITNTGSILVSLNIKPRERIERRATMTEFMRAIQHDQMHGDWLDHAVEDLPTQPAYTFRQERVTARLNLANLEVSSETS